MRISPLLSSLALLLGFALIASPTLHAEDSITLPDLEETLLNQAFTDLVGKDQFEAAAQLRELEANLEASYLLTSRLSNLSLLNFL